MVGKQKSKGHKKPEKEVCLYSVLEIERTADESAIRKAYRKLAMRWHPDKCPSTGDAEQQDEFKVKFQSIGEAYAVLSDAEKRERYDATGRWRDDDDDDNDDHLDDFMAMFNMMFMSHGAPGGRRGMGHMPFHFGAPPGFNFNDDDDDDERGGGGRGGGGGRTGGRGSARTRRAEAAALEELMIHLAAAGMEPPPPVRGGGRFGFVGRRGKAKGTSRARPRPRDDGWESVDSGDDLRGEGGGEQAAQAKAAAAVGSGGQQPPRGTSPPGDGADGAEWYTTTDDDDEGDGVAAFASAHHAPLGRKQLMCTACGKAFCTFNILEAHVGRAHAKQAAAWYADQMEEAESDESGEDDEAQAYAFLMAGLFAGGGGDDDDSDAARRAKNAKRNAKRKAKRKEKKAAAQAGAATGAVAE